MLKTVATDIEALQILDERLRWLSAWTIHHANHVRDNEDGLKVGGHQASCASMTALMAALYFHALGPNDKVAVKPHAGPVLHAIHYLLGTQSLEALENFLKGALESATNRLNTEQSERGNAIEKLTRDLANRRQVSTATREVVWRIQDDVVVFARGGPEAVDASRREQLVLNDPVQ